MASKKISKFTNGLHALVTGQISGIFINAGIFENVHMIMDKDRNYTNEILIEYKGEEYLVTITNFD